MASHKLINMKQRLLVFTCSLGWTLYAPAQSVPAAIDQLAALHTLAQTIDQGYQTINNGLTTIGGLRAAEYRLHQDFVHGLDIVQPLITTDEKTAALRVRLSKLIAQLRATRQYWQQQPTQ